MKSKTSGKVQWGMLGVIIGIGLMVATIAIADDAQPIQVSVGESAVVAVENVAKLALADPTVADVVPLSDKEISVIGKKPGVTTLTIVRSDGKPTVSYRVEVGNDAAAVTIRQMIGQPGVSVRSIGDTLVLDGQVDNELQAQRAAQIATAYKEKVLNLLEVKKPRQVKIQTRVLEVSRDATKNMGIEYFGPNGIVKYGFGRTDFSEGITGLNAFSGHGFLNPQASGDQTLSLGTTPVGVDATLQLLISKNYAKVLSEPTLITLSGKEASFLVGQEVPILQQLPNSFTVQFKEVGVRMIVKPVADSENRVNTTINAEVSQIVRFARGDFGEVPIIGSKKASTQLQVPDGRTIVIGGLLENNLSKDALRKLPWLGDIPVLGMLFRSKQFEQNQTEVLFFMTPTIVKDVDAETAAAAKTPVMKDWKEKAAEQMLELPKKGHDWGMHDPDGLGFPEMGKKAEPAATGKEPATNYKPAKTSGK